ncbi:MAG: tetratricopeptide repeat protein [Pseudomonadales bacterium]
MNWIRTSIDALTRRGVIRACSIYAGVAWLLIGIADVGLPLIEAPSWVLPALIWALLAGLPLTAVLAWFFKSGTGGIELDDASEPASTRPLRDVVIVSVLLALLATSVYLNLTGVPNSDHDLRTIAVLPFRDLSVSGDQTYLAEGVAEELLNTLARIDELRVVSRNSSFALGGGKASTAQIASQLGVGSIIEGSVRSLGEVVRVSVRLIDAANDTNLWSLTYERGISDLFALQDEIAADVARELSVAPRYARAFGEVDPQVYPLVLRARHLYRQFTQESLVRAEELLLEALTLAPDYLAARNALAAVYSTQVGEGFTNPTEGLQKARAALQQIIDDDPRNAEALAGLGWLSLRYDNDLPVAADYLERSLALAGGTADVLGTASGLLFRLRRMEEAIAIAKRVTLLDPLSAFAHANLGIYQLYAGDQPAAITAYEDALELSPRFVGARYAIGLAETLRGNHEAALASMILEEDAEFRTKGTAIAQWAAGDKAAFQTALEHLIAEWGDIWPSEVAEVYAFSGKIDQAFAWIERDIKGSGGTGWAEAVLNPLYEPLHDDPRWAELLNRLDLAPEQLAKIQFNMPATLLQTD